MGNSEIFSRFCNRERKVSRESFEIHRAEKRWTKSTVRMFYDSPLVSFPMCTTEDLPSNVPVVCAVGELRTSGMAMEEVAFAAGNG